MFVDVMKITNKRIICLIIICLSEEDIISNHSTLVTIYFWGAWIKSMFGIIRYTRTIGYANVCLSMQDHRIKF